MKKVLLSFFVLTTSLFSFEKSALIFGITGQDGAYLTELLLKKGYIVHGVKRRSSSLNTERLDRFYEEIQHASKFILHYGDITDSSNVHQLIQTIQPDEIYNLAAQSHVKVSFELPVYTALTSGLGALYILEAIRSTGLEKKTKYYQASTSELYGGQEDLPQSETTHFLPQSPYATAKLFAYWTTVNYRDAYGIFASNGILFNHESPLRGETFVTKKITKKAVQQILGLSSSSLYLGNLDAKRDWGYAKDYVEAMWLMLQQETPDDYVIAMNETHSVREFVERTYKELGVQILWQGKGIDEIGVDAKTGKILVQIDPRYFRPNEVPFLLGDSNKAKKNLGWKPKTSFAELIRIMVQADYEKESKRLMVMDLQRS